MTKSVRILVAVDGSVASRRAVELVRAFDLGRECRVVVMSVVEPLPPMAAGSDPVTGQRVRQLAAAYLTGEKQGAHEVVDAAVSDLRRAGVTAERLVRVGPVASTIRRVCREQHVDLVALGSRGRGGFAGLLLGSVSREVAETAPCSVLVARGPDPASHDDTKWPSHLLVAVDSSPASRVVLDVVAGLPWSAATHVRVVSVGEIDLDAPDEMFELAREGATAVVGRAAARLSSRFPRLDPDVTVGSPASEIIDLARSWPADLIVVGTRGRRGIVALALGSVSRQVLLHATCAVLVARTPPPTQLQPSA